MPVAHFTERVAKLWKEDDFFGYQFLNGLNPTTIKRCTELPHNFPVTEEMVKTSLKKGSSLKEEMEVWRLNWDGLGFGYNVLSFCLRPHWNWINCDWSESITPTERQHLHLWSEEDGWDPRQGRQRKTLANNPWTLSLLPKPRKENDANCNTGCVLYTLQHHCF